MIKAFICEVRSVSGSAQPLQCENDAKTIFDALTNSLKISAEHITVLSNQSGIVNKDNFIEKFKEFCRSILENDTIIFYFSGHGCIIEQMHYLVFSDAVLNTASLLTELDQFKTSEKIIFLDCCYSGNVITDIENSNIVYTTIDSISKAGINIFASCQKLSKAYITSEIKTGTFTWFLTRAMADKGIIRNGQISLWDIVTLTRFFIEVYCREFPEKHQTVTFQKFGLKDVYFKVSKHCSKRRVKHKLDFKNFYITDMEPLHGAAAKRYIVKAILTTPQDIRALSDITEEIVQTVKQSEICNTNISKNNLSDNTPDIIYIYFSLDERNITYGNFLIYATWYADIFTKPASISERHEFCINNVVYKPNPMYFHNNDYQNAKTATEKEYSEVVINAAEKTISTTSTLISQYNKLRNGECPLACFVKTVQPFIHTIKIISDKSANFKFPPDNYVELDHIIQALIAAAYNVADELDRYYSGNGMIYLLEVNIKKYYDIVREYNMKVG